MSSGISSRRVPNRRPGATVSTTQTKHEREHKTHLVRARRSFQAEIRPAAEMKTVLLRSPPQPRYERKSQHRTQHTHERDQQTAHEARRSVVGTSRFFLPSACARAVHKRQQQACALCRRCCDLLLWQKILRGLSLVNKKKKRSLRSPTTQVRSMRLHPRTETSPNQEKK